MSFLSRRTSRPDRRASDGAGRRADSGYGDYDYAPDDYQQDDDNWSPDEYFSPEGIKGRWAAGARPGDRSGDRGRREDDRGYDGYGPGPQRGRGPAGRYDRDSYPQDSYKQDGPYGGDEYGTGEYGTGEFAAEDYGTGAYEVQDGPDDDRGERGGGRRRRGERGGGERRRRRGRRDKGDDIWPDDGVSDEDYWASVAADRPLTSTGSALDDPMNVVNNRPLARPMGAPRPLGESRTAGEPRTGSGRLGPAPGQAGYLPSHGAGSRPMPGPVTGSTGPAGPAGATSGPMPRHGAGPNSGPQPRPGTGPTSGPMPRHGTGPGSGPMPRHGAGPNPTAGSNSGPMPRPGTGPHSGPMARPAVGSGTGPTPARSGTGPASARPATGPNAARPAAGLAQPLLGPSGHVQQSQSHIPPSLQATTVQPSLSAPGLSGAGLPQPSPPQPSFQPNTTRGGRQPEHPDWTDRTERIDRITQAGYPDPRANGRSQDRRLPDVREPSRSGSSAGRRGIDDDPLTSKAWSREELVNTDGRSYRVASRRAHVSADRYTAALSEQTQTFSMDGQYQSDQQAADGYPVRGGQHGQQSREPSNPYDSASASYPYPGQPYASRPAPREQDEDRYGRPAARPGASGPPDRGHNGGGYYGNSYSDNGRHNGHYGNGRH